MTLNLDFKVALLRRGMKQKQLAQILEKSESAVSSWVAGKHRPVKREREVIAIILGIHESELFGDGTKISDNKRS